MAGKHKPGAGRPKKILDEEQIRELASIQCTLSEIAAVMRVSVEAEKMERCPYAVLSGTKL